MNLHEVKAAIPAWNNTVLQFNKSESKTINPQTNKPDVWVNGWQDAERVRVSIPLELFDRLKTGELMNNLGIKSESKISKTEGNKPYMQYIVYAYTAGDAGEL